MGLSYPLGIGLATDTGQMLPVRRPRSPPPARPEPDACAVIVRCQSGV